MVGAATAVLGCGDDASSSGSASDTTDAPGTSEATTSVGSSDASADPSGDPPTDTGGDTTTMAMTGADAESGPGPVIFDLGGLPDAPPVTCSGPGGKGGGGGGGSPDLSYIWIANSAQSTVSKIDTTTMEEEGRYFTRQAGGDPSRTSVNLNGDVAVANRNGGVAKFWADPADCDENNGQPGLQTSSGGNDVLAWDDEECRAWFLPLVCGSNRPVAWTRGEWSETSCAYINPKLWTVCDAQVLLVDGETGDVEQNLPLAANAFVYGGAADADGNFWGLDSSNGNYFRVDFQDQSIQTYPSAPGGAYGITVDRHGRPWACSSTVSRLNDDGTWSASPVPTGGGGCMTDGEDTIWHASGNSMIGIDIETLQQVNQIPLPEYVHGISIDFAGKVWGVGFASSNAYRADPESLQVETFSALVGAYTYSDMTGFALSTAGGGEPPG
jgi:hypothetical protein